MIHTITELITGLGNLTIELLLLPLVIWTLISLAALTAFKLFEEMHPVYQYHGRIALLCSLPLGILASLPGQFSFFSSPGELEAISKLITIQNPLPAVTASASGQAGLLNPTFLTGVAVILAGLFSLVYLARMAMTFSTLRTLTRRLVYLTPDRISQLTAGNRALLEESSARIAFSGEIEIPFTFGWRHPSIVLPRHLKKDPAKLNMALRHELIHIRQRDYPLNIMLVTIRALFWSHPVVHILYKEFRSYREMACDARVLSDITIPQKKYAEFLFELAPKKGFPAIPTVSMSVNSSTLKKRIRTMKKSTSQKSSVFNGSFYLMILSMLLITGIIACSDLETDGITNTELEETQRQIEFAPDGKQPIFELNGERTDAKHILARLKPKYITSVDVLKGEKAINEYGDEGKNGVLKINLIDKEKALNDLRDAPPPSSGNTSGTITVEKEYFVQVDEMPKMEEGLASLQECLEYPGEAVESGKEGRVIVRFIVNRQGSVEMPEILRGVRDDMDEEAIRCVKQQSFKPGLENGEAVPVQLSVPVGFRLSHSEK